jgi:hypothetical protein
LVSPENLQVLGKSSKDITKVTYADYFPGSSYLEADVAWSSDHPLIGSGSACIVFNDNSSAYIDNIFCQDCNPKKNHAKGMPHWNHDGRWYLSTWTAPKVTWKEPALRKIIRDHIIDKSPWIEITAKAPGQAQKQVTCYWR